MAGVKQFDRHEALDRAMAAFWSRGYEATSIDDLVQATRIGRGSLYGTFGDKRQLFLAALDHYWNTVGMEMFSVIVRSGRTTCDRTNVRCSDLVCQQPKIAARLPFH